jgi:hypothetical protein
VIEFEGFIKKEEPKDDEMIDETEEAINKKQKELEELEKQQIQVINHKDIGSILHPTPPITLH